MKNLILIAFISLVISCASYEDHSDIISKAYKFEPRKDEAVIYILRDFQKSSNPVKLRFDIMKLVDPESRNKLSDAMNALDGDSIEGAGIPHDFFFTDKKSFSRLEMPPGKYVMYSYFFLASTTDIIPSKKIMDFKAGNVYALKIIPKPVGAYSSTIYLLQEISTDEATHIIKNEKLKLLKFTPFYKG